MLQKLSPYEILASEKWHSALFTTFSLSLSFFEAVLFTRFVPGAPGASAFRPIS
jgi:hypothetical protein